MASQRKSGDEKSLRDVPGAGRESEQVPEGRHWTGKMRTALLPGLQDQAPQASPLARIKEWLQEQNEFDRRTSHAAIQKGKMFILLSETSPDPHFIMDLSFRYVYVNSALERMLKRSKKDLLGQRDRDFYSQDEAHALESACSRVLEGWTIREKHVRNLGGVPRTFLDTMAPWKDDSGNITAIYATSVDVTDNQEPWAQTEIAGNDYRSPAMRETMTQALLVAKVDTTVLLTGESGSGKDFLARYIHDHSGRSKGPFRSINCAALPEHLVESELFGYEKDAFNLAFKTKRGLIELADGGTLLLNELGELPLSLQAKLLTFLDTNSFTRVGGEKEIQVDVRILAATNRNLEREIEEDAFRADLFYRLNVFSIRMPPLRERIEDLPMLIKTLMIHICQRLGLKSQMKFSQSFIQALLSYRWPGNIRELKNVLEKAIVLAAAKGVPLDANCLDLPNADHTSGVDQGDMPSQSRINNTQREKAVNDQGHQVPRMASPKRPTKPNTADLENLYADYIVKRGWTRARLAHELEVDSSTLKKWFKAAGLPAGDRGRPRKAGAPEALETD